MATFVLIHGGGDAGWYWHLVEADLRRRGHHTLAPDLPCDDDSAGLAEYADTVVRAAAGRGNLVVAAQSFGGFTAPLVATRLPVAVLALVAGMIPAPGEAPRDWPTNTGFDQVMGRQARRYEGQDLIYHDVPPPWPSRPGPGHGTSPTPPATPPGRMAAGAHPVRPVHQGPVLPARVHAPGRGRPARRRTRRDRRRARRRAQPPQGTGRPARQLRSHRRMNRPSGARLRPPPASLPPLCGRS
jgi:pimeloyl-ACP methyl ester carboxylesterase